MLYSLSLSFSLWLFRTICECFAGWQWFSLMSETFRCRWWSFSFGTICCMHQLWNRIFDTHIDVLQSFRCFYLAPKYQLKAVLSCNKFSIYVLKLYVIKLQFKYLFIRLWNYNVRYRLKISDRLFIITIIINNNELIIISRRCGSSSTPST